MYRAAKKSERGKIKNKVGGEKDNYYKVLTMTIKNGGAIVLKIIKK